MLQALARHVLRDGARACIGSGSSGALSSGAPVGVAAGAAPSLRRAPSSVGSGVGSGSGGAIDGDAAAAAAAAAEREEVAAEIASSLRRLGLSPGTGCELGDGLAAVDVGVLVGNPPVQVRGPARRRRSAR
ncbi:hypothetical protein Rsub_12325 [Raphidocelis subcapitata]|uniref:Uncharacterized protein n=1 Tax=Raphidocelis subcapitata TaxID=307507 RepID=A0A2V0PK49_9CHLO|nr:hypothetical protein Rsub_12325 [Raphidocelis subcapitata]|eukprot:GBF99392.1 hypothetical protein Rsub_12325 [Raphidocelis subcapitata]